MDVLDIELPPQHFHCNRNKTQGSNTCEQRGENIKTLGALLGEENDVKREMQLADRLGIQKNVWALCRERGIAGTQS